MSRSLAIVPAGMSAITDLDPKKLEWRLRVARIPRARWEEIDELVDLMFDEYRKWEEPDKARFCCTDDDIAILKTGAGEIE